MVLVRKTLLRLSATAILFTGICAAAIPAAQATVLFDNLADSQDGSDPVFGIGPLADSFNSGSIGQELWNLQIELTNSSSSFTGTLQALLILNNNGVPGMTVATLTSVPVSSIGTGSAATYNFDPTTVVYLSANTTYWVELSDTQPNGVEWVYSDSTVGTGLTGQSSYSAEYGAATDASNGAYMMHVEVPEPVSAALLLAGLTGLSRLRRRRAA